MPNWVTNYVYATDQDGNQISCNKIIDVMRWTSDDVVSEHQAEEQITFNKVTPMPNELLNTRSPATFDGDDKYNNSTKEKSDALINKYGHDNWYDWAWDNWGTKWDLAYTNIPDPDSEGNIFVFGFETAWSTPEALIKSLSSLVKDVNIEVEFSDEDYGSNYGKYTCCNGEMTKQVLYDYEDYTSGNEDAVRILDELQGVLDDEEVVYMKSFGEENE